MGHTHLGAVLILYMWTFAAAVGVLLFMFVPWYFAVGALVIAAVVCVVLTFLPLTRSRQESRKVGSRMRPMMLRILRWGGLLAVAMFVIGGWIGWATAGGPGLVSAILGTGLAIVFMALTAASFLIADAVTKGKPSIVVFFGTILGVFAVKVVVFVILTIWLRTQTWLSPSVFGVTAIIAVVGTLVIDFVASARSRIPLRRRGPSSGERRGIRPLRRGIGWVPRGARKVRPTVRNTPEI